MIRATNKKNDDHSDVDTITVATKAFYFLFDSDVINLATQQNIWVIDSGASIHATSKKEFFAFYTPGDFESLGWATTNHKCNWHQKCTLGNKNGCKLILMNVKHIPNIRMNLILTSKLDDKIVCNTFDNGKWGKLTKALW